MYIFTVVLIDTTNKVIYSAKWSSSKDKL